jgi:hypothetical protein
MRPLVPTAACVMIALAGCGGGQTTVSSAPPPTTTTATGVQGPSEVSAEPVDHAGDNPFTPPVGKDKKNVKPPARAVSGGAPVSYKGNLPGLYGGTNNYSTCDKEQLVSFLQATPDKANAWAQSLGISTSEISTFIDGTTAVTLRTDVRVTNHGFVNGVANPIQSVLQAGTAVLVNSYGRPVVKCFCGNPLTAPLTYATPTYTGPIWTGFEPSHITIINQSTTIINVFKLYDPDSGRIFARPAGTDGTRDKPYHGPGGTPKPTPPPTETVPPTESVPPDATITEEQPPPASENPGAYFDPASGTVDSTYTLYVTGFQSGTMAVDLTRPDGVHENYSIEVGSDGSGHYTFPHNGDPILGTYTAVITNPATGASASASTTVNG